MLNSQLRDCFVVFKGVRTTVSARTLSAGGGCIEIPLGLEGENASKNVDDCSPPRSHEAEGRLRTRAKVVRDDLWQVRSMTLTVVVLLRAPTRRLARPHTWHTAGASVAIPRPQTGYHRIRCSPESTGPLFWNVVFCPSVCLADGIIHQA